MDWSTAWADAQQQFWDAWQGMIGTAEKPSAPYTQRFEQWRELAIKTIENWTGDAGITRQGAEQCMKCGSWRAVEQSAVAER